MAEPSLNWKQLLLTAFITCVFTVIAGALTYSLTTKAPALAYSVSSGPVLPAGPEYKQIFIMEVRNTGSREVQAVLGQVSLSAGTIEAAAYAGSPGLRPQEKKFPNLYEVEVPTLNPEEHFSLSLMVNTPSTATTPVFGVRGAGVVGTEEKGSSLKGRKEVFIPIAAGAVAAGLGILASITPALRKFIGSRRIRVLDELFFTRSGEVGPFDRNEIVAYILARCGLQQESETFRFASAESSYMGASDFILVRGLAVQGEKPRRPFLTALQCLLLVEEMAEVSKEVLQRAICKLSEGRVQEARIKEIKQRAVKTFVDSSRLRDEVDRLVEENQLLVKD